MADSALDQAATPDDVTSAWDDPDYVPAGATPATSTAEAQSYARDILNRALSGKEDEASLIKNIEEHANAAKEVLRQAQQRLLSPEMSQPDPEAMKWRQAASWLQPGNFAQGFGGYARERAEEAELRRQLGISAAGAGLGLEEKIQGIDEATLNQKLDLLKARQTMMGTLGKAAMTQLGRSIGKPTSSLASSKHGKEAVDMGLTPGTPEFTDYVTKASAADLAATTARAGLDAEEISPEEKHAVANQAGVPAEIIDPYRGMSTRQKLQAQRITMQNAEKRFGTYGVEDAQTQAALRDIDKFNELNKVTYTGPAIAPIGLGGVHAGLHGVGVEGERGGAGLNINPLSWIAGWKTNIQEMNKIANNLATTAIPARGFGRVTNRDLSVFQSAMIGTDKAQHANESISQALKIRLQNDLDRHEFEQAYTQVHKTDQGWEKQWNTYLNDNPIFDPKQPVTTHKDGRVDYNLNPGRLRYDDYFRQKNGPAPGEGDELEGLTPAERRMATTPAKARGGRLHFDDGGSVTDKLAALRSGLTLKTDPQEESPNEPASNFGEEALGGTGTLAALLALSRLKGRFGGIGAPARAALRHPILGSSAIGGGAGAIAGASDPYQGDALSYGLTGAMLGPLARYGVSRGYGGVAGLLDKLRGQGVSGGERRAIEAITSDNPDWNSVAGQLRADARAKVPSTLADVGPRTQGLAETALRKDTPETAQLGSQLEQRQEGANARVAEQTNQALKPDEYLSQTQKLRDALYENARPLYEGAYKAHPAVQSQALMELMNTPAGQEAAARAFTMMKNEQIPVGVADATGMIQKPSLQYLDYVKRAMDDMIGREEGAGATYQATQEGRILRNMRGKLVNEVDQATLGPNGQPGLYQQARQQYAGDLEVIDALRSGREDFLKLTPNELKARVGQMSFAERDAFRSGVAEGLFQKLGNTPEIQNPARKLISTPALQEKVGALFEQPGEATKYLGALQREADLFDQSRGMISASKQGQKLSASPKSLYQLGRSTLMTKGTAGDIASTLSTSALDPQANAKIARLRGVADRLRSRAENANLAGTAGAGGISAALTPSPMQQD